jgi:hypothetical protein
MVVMKQGMIYLHKSAFQSHGHLTSEHCYLNSRWVLKIGGLGLSIFRGKFKTDQVMQLNVISFFHVSTGMKSVESVARTM